MTTRSIVTSQPDVACEVCERRLLRGEHPDVFLAAGRRRLVCELCAPRAVHEGWRREADSSSLALSPLRPRRGRNLFERLRQVGRPAGTALPADAEGSAYDPERAPYEAALAAHDPDPQPYDFLTGLDVDDREPATQSAADRSHARSVQPAAARPAAREATPTERAIEVFNASEFPRRIAGIARSLGAPSVNVATIEDAVGVAVAIVVAWELCWYRYEVDLDEDEPAARLAAQGTELEELARGERQANALADERGGLSAAGA
jgi:hypothetical protein